MYLLDTNVLSELRRPERANHRVKAWAAASPAALFYISSITVLEIEHGILLIERRDRQHGAQLRTWFEEEIVVQFEQRILAIDTAVARRCAQLHVPDRRPERDALVAATALVHDMTVITRNVVDFQSTGVALINPWDVHL
jgi:toxin FitB